MRARATVILLAGIVGCAPGGGPNEDDPRDPTALAQHVAYSSVKSSMDNVRDYMTASPSPEAFAEVKGIISEDMEYFEEFANDERLDQNVYQPALEIWKKMHAAENGAEMNAGLRELAILMRKAPNPPPIPLTGQTAQ